MPAHYVQIGPANFSLRSPFPALMREMRTLYRDYPSPGPDAIHDFAIRLKPTSWWRRWYRSSLNIEADHELDEFAPLEGRLALLGFEMGMNLQMALGYRRHLIFHAASSAKDGRGLLIVGDSGAGKSTLSALLCHKAGWRHLGDEFALVTPGPNPQLVGYPRPISLKNDSIEEVERRVPDAHFGPILTGTPKGVIRHVVPPAADIAAWNDAVRPALLVAPRFQKGGETTATPIPQGTLYARLATASTNQTKMGEPGFESLTALVRSTPAYDITYGSSEAALDLIGDLWAKAL